MKKILLLSWMLCIGSVFGQNNDFGTKFEFSTKYEKDAKFVLKDNYNHYLFSALNVEGMLTKNQLLLRKFDQKNVLVDTYIHDYGAKDRTTLNNYLGFYEIGNEKIVVFTESYSGKLKKKEWFKHVFDKKTAKFETTLLATFEIESLMKSGTTLVRKSENGNFFGLDFIPRKEKEAPEMNKIMVFGANGELAWQKDVEADPAFATFSLTVTNSGKMVLQRNPKSWKVGNTMVLVSAETTEAKKFNEEIKLNEMRSVTIGEQEYLIGFNSPNKGIRTGDFDDLVFYDLTAGTILKNNKVSGFSAIKGIKNVNINGLFYENEEIVIFAEAQADIPMTAAIGAPVSFDPNFNNLKPSVFVLGKDGTLKSQNDLYTERAYNFANFFKSFGVLNVKGNYFLNYSYADNYNTYGRLARIDASNQYKNSGVVYDSSQIKSTNRLVAHLLAFFPDSNRTVFAIMTSDTEMQLVNVYNVKY
ncbi:MAG: hypothetical protein KBC56_03985 [Flavobacterium sp.]|nr:hypothetical protein [Flavobacterium sp.]